MSAPEGAVTQVQEWLESRGQTLFGRAFDLSQNSDAAARWFADQVDDFLLWKEARDRRGRSA